MNTTPMRHRPGGLKGRFSASSLIFLLLLLPLLNACGDAEYAPAELETAGLSDFQAVLKNASGFGRKTTGGKNGKVVEVTNLKDSGSGSLRAAMDVKGPKWIVFKRGLSGEIRLRDILEVSKNTTIDGRGAKITISGDTLEIDGNSRYQPGKNVAIMYLNFKNAKDDALRVRDGAKNIWIHQNSFERSGDGLIDIIRGGTDVTVSWNKFSNHSVVALLGSKCSQDDNLKITLHHNYFDGVGERSPKVNCGKVHTYNNYNHRWRNVAARVEKGGEIYSEANIYEAGSRKRASNYSSPGYMRSVNDLMQNGAYHKLSKSDRVFKPSHYYSYRAEKAGSSLKSKILRNAGWQKVSRP